LVKELKPTEEELDFLHDVFASIWDAIVKKGGKICDVISAVEIYGSAINGLAIRGNSDLDMSVFYPND
jgi:tRNA nucleotidyltransferase (CCA-adding enzyme)